MWESKGNRLKCIGVYTRERKKRRSRYKVEVGLKAYSADDSSDSASVVRRRVVIVPLCKAGGAAGSERVMWWCSSVEGCKGVTIPLASSFSFRAG